MHEEVVGDIATMIREIRRDDKLVIQEETPIDSLGIDSLDFVELMFKIEEKYDIDVDFNANTDGTFPFPTVGSAADAVRTLITQKHAIA